MTMINPTFTNFFYIYRGSYIYRLLFAVSHLWKNENRKLEQTYGIHSDVMVCVGLVHPSCMEGLMNCARGNLTGN
jgi:hypothetical protein